MEFGEAYLSGWFSNLICKCGTFFGPDGLDMAREHWELGHYKE